MEFDQVELRKTDLGNQTEMAAIIALLSDNGLDFDDDVEYTIGAFSDDILVGTGSFARQVLKCFAVDESLRGTGLMNRLISHLVAEQFNQGRNQLFVYTKIKNRAIFEELGFYPVICCEEVILLENRRDGPARYVEAIKASVSQTEGAGAIVVNCNPFTYGHRYIIEKAAGLCPLLYVFVVREDRSIFSFEDRISMVRAGTADLHNVSVQDSGSYIISSATFPSYFIKDKKKVSEMHARLDLALFSEKIAHPLGIVNRFVGSEPYCPVTNHYNETMKQLLPEYGIAVTEFERKAVGERYISASEVRRLLTDKNFEALQELVPPTTIERMIKNDSI